MATQAYLEPHQPHCQLLFLNKSDRNFEFELCDNIEDKFNDGIPCITHSVVFHAFLWRSQILLTFNRHHVIYSVFCIVPGVEF